MFLITLISVLTLKRESAQFKLERAKRPTLSVNRMRRGLIRDKGARVSSTKGSNVTACDLGDLPPLRITPVIVKRPL